jgi:hypothetical protein
MKVAVFVLVAMLVVVLPWKVKAGQSSRRVPVAPSQSSAEGFRLGGGVPSGAMILTDTEAPPAGYTFAGLSVLARTGVSQSWTSRAPMTTTRYFLAAAAVDGLVYAIGGSVSTLVARCGRALRPATNSWATVASCRRLDGPGRSGPQREDLCHRRSHRQ